SISGGTLPLTMTLPISGKLIVPSAATVNGPDSEPSLKVRISSTSLGPTAESVGGAGMVGGERAGARSAQPARTSTAGTSTRSDTMSERIERIGFGIDIFDAS